MREQSIEIAHRSKLKHIREITSALGLQEDEVEPWGRHSAKVRLQTMERLKERPDGRLVLVTAMTPTRFGEGKTLTTVGLGQALPRIGKKGLITLREPSVGPVFGVKGGGCGGGHAQVAPMEKINLHFNGDLHAITTAHNLLAALLDNHLFRGNELGIDVRQVLWPRALDMNERALRQVVIGLGGLINGIPREGGFVMTAASEIMAILALAASRADLKRRLSEIVVALDRDKQMIKAGDLNAQGSMAATLNEAVEPNLVQTLEHTPAFIHAGPFANIAHGTCSVLSNRMALKLADYVVTEAGFAADLGAEKFFDLVCRTSGLWPSAVVIVATCQALKHHGGVDASQIQQENTQAIRDGFVNLRTHIRNIQKFGVPAVVGVNRFPFDTDAEIATVVELCQEMGAACEPHEAFMQGGAGAEALAQKVVEAADGAGDPKPRYIYELSDEPKEKIRRVATEIYGADDVVIEPAAQKALKQFWEAGYGDLPICMAKTQSSLSDNPKALGAPKGWTLHVNEVRLSAGAGFLVVVCGNMMLLPGLPKVPSAMRIDVDDDGRITGLF
ncbi:MAG TPA: formate--tetrahydrofolate ligase [Acidobacteriota bacterium]|nr:formate--tetrahydrofolate ligase [Acidobacteriota bacterium]